MCNAHMSYVLFASAQTLCGAVLTRRKNIALLIPWNVPLLMREAWLTSAIFLAALLTAFTKSPKGGSISSLCLKLRSSFPLSTRPGYSDYFFNTTKDPSMSSINQYLLEKQENITIKSKRRARKQSFISDSPVAQTRSWHMKWKKNKHHKKYDTQLSRVLHLSEAVTVLVWPQHYNVSRFPGVSELCLLKLDGYLSIILFRPLWCGQVWPSSLPYQAWKHPLY